MEDDTLLQQSIERKLMKMDSGKQERESYWSDGRRNIGLTSQAEEPYPRARDNLWVFVGRGERRQGLDTYKVSAGHGTFVGRDIAQS